MLQISETERMRMKKYLLPSIMFSVFEAVAVSLWLSKNNLFYLFNFSYIGIHYCPR